MPDISMCENKDCPLRNDCYRFIAEPNPYRQAYARFKFAVVDGKPTCDNYWPVTTDKLDEINGEAK